MWRQTKVEDIYSKSTFLSLFDFLLDWEVKAAGEQGDRSDSHVQRYSLCLSLRFYLPGSTWLFTTPLYVFVQRYSESKTQRGCKPHRAVKTHYVRRHFWQLCVKIMMLDFSELRRLQERTRFQEAIPEVFSQKLPNCRIRCKRAATAKGKMGPDKSVAYRISHRVMSWAVLSN